ncbi:hypothetical protein [Sphaerobacter thermophilus]|uniref:Uncharacterized protein n=1 Tax=Sphaerobacter thermophilus (strain ATCC 49802 / DSM 20745 / KCCM 41009 / NCIMB 13125 / S 6022) TaxID=479434 RepID=D1C2R3_SPHTD|nr:hypothetical protein [Sphaerobacter thermophilus]ACZ38530.1 conserved hypothetical protein [Sphaerobacter thermophilus DSM 20745]PZN68057.1 MAG: hypothetical protein DIU58_01225 [Sphaerobacter thermophilus]
MLDHTGTRRVRYEDTFRAIGHYLDEHRFTRIALIETPEGFLIKAYATVDSRSDSTFGVPQTYLFTNEDIDHLLENAYARRRSPSR